MTLGDRLMVLNGGHVEQFGSPIELYERPASLFVAGFIGSPAMNFLPGVLGDDRRTIRLGPSAELSFGEPLSSGLNDVTVGIRPEHFTETPDGPIRLIADVAEQLGAETLVHGALAGTDTPLTASLAGIREIDPGATLTFGIAPDLVHAFDPTTSRRLDTG
jgi:sn-glycerol 3-phosphate transport system ATP-binding protein